MWLFTTLVFMSGSRATASSFLVTSTNDSIHAGSLRAAIIAANRAGGNSLIRLAGSPRVASIYQLTIPGADEDGARTGDLDITRGNITIIGIGPNVTIDATALGDRVFQVFPRAHLTLENLQIRGGSAPAGSQLTGEAGGAIYNAGTLTLQHCIISENASGPGQPLEGNGGGTSGGDGGGVYNSGMLSAINCQFAGNVSGTGFDGAEGGNGGAIRNDGRCLLTDCVIIGNRAGDGGSPEGNAFGLGGSGGNGGAIYNTGTMILQNCNVGGNSAGGGASGAEPSGDVTFESPGGPGGNGGSGGGIYNTGKLELEFSAVYYNDCGSGGNGGSFGSGGAAGSGGSGGGFLNTGTLSLNTSTISANAAGNGGYGGNATFLDAGAGGDGGNGGGICNAVNQQSASLSISSCTIALNLSGALGISGIPIRGNPGPAGAPGTGGGVWTGITNATVRNTLIATNLVNIGANGAGLVEGDVLGSFASQGFNLLGTGDGSTGFTNGVNADQVGTDASPIDPLLGPLQMNGGPTATHALLPGSPAIDQGNSFGIHFDQRHDKRPFVFSTIPAPGGDGSDIGAFELESP